jgi:broad specificity phosphatase PhoE
MVLGMDSPPMSTRLVVIRHGESNSTVGRFVGGHDSCTGLSERGRRQAEALRDRLIRTGELKDTSVLVTSILPRAIETAEIISPGLGGHVADERCDFCEIHPGEADGITWEEFEARYRPSVVGRNPYRAFAPGAESWAEFFARVGKAIHALTDEHKGETIVVVAHGGVIEGTLSVLSDLPVRRGFEVIVENTSLSEWKFETNYWGQERWHMVRFNDFAHLQGLDDQS